MMGKKALAVPTLNNLSYDATFFFYLCEKFRNSLTCQSYLPGRPVKLRAIWCVRVLCQCLRHTLTSNWHFMCILALIGNHILSRTTRTFFFPQSLIRLPKSTLCTSMKSSWKLLFAVARPAHEFLENGTCILARHLSWEGIGKQSQWQEILPVIEWSGMVNWPVRALRVIGAGKTLPLCHNRFTTCTRGKFRKIPSDGFICSRQVDGHFSSSGVRIKNAQVWTSGDTCLWKHPPQCHHQLKQPCALWAIHRDSCQHCPLMCVLRWIHPTSPNLVILHLFFFF